MNAFGVFFHCGDKRKFALEAQGGANLRRGKGHISMLLRAGLHARTAENTTPRALLAFAT